MKLFFGTLSAIVLLLSTVVMVLSFVDQRHMEDVAKSVIVWKIERELVERVPALGDADSKTSRAFHKTFGKLAGNADDDSATGAETLSGTLQAALAPVCLCVPSSIDALTKPDSEAGRMAQLRAKAISGIRVIMAEIYAAQVKALLLKVRIIAGQMMAAGLLGLYICIFGIRDLLRPQHYTLLDACFLPVTVLEICAIIGISFFASFILSVGGVVLIGLHCLLLLILLDIAFNDDDICGSIIDIG